MFVCVSMHITYLAFPACVRARPQMLEDPSDNCMTHMNPQETA